MTQHVTHPRPRQILAATPPPPLTIRIVGVVHETIELLAVVEGDGVHAVSPGVRDRAGGVSVLLQLLVVGVGFKLTAKVLGEKGLFAGLLRVLLAAVVEGAFEGLYLFLGRGGG